MLEVVQNFVNMFDFENLDEKQIFQQEETSIFRQINKLIQQKYGKFFRSAAGV
jgi:hypothetical protein